MTSRQWIRRATKPVLFVLCVLPLANLLWKGWADTLGANPIEAITHSTGIWTLRFLLITLTVTPVRRLSGWSEAIRLRRMLGLFAFFYGTLHMTTYVWLDQFFDAGEIVKDVVKRPFITVGSASYLLLLPLALTSTAAMIRRLGGKRWQRLHRLIYVTAVGGVVHYWWLVKADVQRPQRYAAIVALLLGYRLWLAYARRVKRVAAVQGPRLRTQDPGLRTQDSR